MVLAGFSGSMAHSQQSHLKYRVYWALLGEPKILPMPRSPVFGAGSGVSSWMAQLNACTRGPTLAWIGGCLCQISNRNRFWLKIRWETHCGNQGSQQAPPATFFAPRPTQDGICWRMLCCQQEHIPAADFNQKRLSLLAVMWSSLATLRREGCQPHWPGLISINVGILCLHRLFW